MDGVCAGGAGDGQDALAVQVGLGGGGGADAVGLVREADVGEGGVDVGVDGDGADAEVAGGTDDAEGDLTAVGDEELRKGGGSSDMSPLFVSDRGHDSGRVVSGGVHGPR